MGDEKCQQIRTEPSATLSVFLLHTIPRDAKFHMTLNYKYDPLENRKVNCLDPIKDLSLFIAGCSFQLQKITV